jgi:hypothetical protein
MTLDNGDELFEMFIQVIILDEDLFVSLKNILNLFIN